MSEYLFDPGNYIYSEVGVGLNVEMFLNTIREIPTGILILKKYANVIGYIGLTPGLVIMACTPAVSNIKRGDQLRMYEAERPRFVEVLSEVSGRKFGDAIVAKRPQIPLVEVDNGTIYTLESMREAIIARLPH